MRFENPTISRMAEIDARRFAEAKMNYGKGAGNQRKMIRAEIDSKKERYPEYAKLFNIALSHIDMGDVARVVESRKSFERKAEIVNRGYRTGKRIVRKATQNTDLIAKFLDIFFGGAR